MSDRRWIEPEKRISLTRKQRVTVFMSTDGRCYVCGCRLGSRWEAEHPQALALMGPGNIKALRPICIPCHKPKTAADKKAIAKCNRVRDKHIGAMRETQAPMPGSRSSPYQKKCDGSVICRKTGRIIKEGYRR